MSETTQTANGIGYATHVEARNTGFVKASLLPQSDNEVGQAALEDSLMTHAREFGVEFDGDDR